MEDLWGSIHLMSCLVWNIRPVRRPGTKPLVITVEGLLSTAQYLRSTSTVPTFAYILVHRCTVLRVGVLVASPLRRTRLLLERSFPPSPYSVHALLSKLGDTRRLRCRQPFNFSPSLFPFGKPIYFFLFPADIFQQNALRRESPWIVVGGALIDAGSDAT